MTIFKQISTGVSNDKESELLQKLGKVKTNLNPKDSVFETSDYVGTGKTLSGLLQTDLLIKHEITNGKNISLLLASKEMNRNAINSLLQFLKLPLLENQKETYGLNNFEIINNYQYKDSISHLHSILMFIDSSIAKNTTVIVNLDYLINTSELDVIKLFCNQAKKIEPTFNFKIIYNIGLNKKEI